MNIWIKVGILAIIAFILTFSFLKAIVIGIAAFFIINK